MPYKKVIDTARAYDTTLRADDERFNFSVRVMLDDGAFFFYPSAFIHKFDDNFYCVFTEHYNFHVYHIDDLVAIDEYKQTSREEIE